MCPIVTTIRLSNSHDLSHLSAAGPRSKSAVAVQCDVTRKDGTGGGKLVLHLGRGNPSVDALPIQLQASDRARPTSSSHEIAWPSLLTKAMAIAGVLTCLVHGLSHGRLDANTDILA